MIRIIPLIITILYTYLTAQSININQLQVDSIISKAEKLRSTKDQIVFLDSAYNLAKESNYLKGKAYSSFYLGFYYHHAGLNDSARVYLYESEKLATQLNDSSLRANCFYKIAYTYMSEYKYNLGLRYLLKAMNIYIDLNNEHQLSKLYLDFAYTYMYWGEEDEVIKYYKKALNLYRKNKQKEWEAMALGNLGFSYFHFKKPDSCIYFHKQAYKLYTELQIENGIAKILHGYGDYYLLIENADSAIYYYTSAYEKRLADAPFAANQSLLRLGEAYGLKQDFNTAISYQLKAYKHIYQEGVSRWKIKANESLRKTYFRMGNKETAYNYLHKTKYLQDSLNNQKLRRQALEMQVIFESKEREAKIKLLNKENELKKIELAKKNWIISFALSGLLLIVVISFLIYKSYLNKKKSNLILEKKNTEIEKQKIEIENIHSELISSIRYAQRIQNAILPNNTDVSKYLNKHFILFKPHSVVSGDFYYINKIKDWILVSVVDCTGHGVPGAFMSMMGIAFINDIVQKKEVINAAQVLDELRSKIISALQQNSVKDGMDMAFCAINIKDQICHYAGAQNPLYLIRNKELNIFKPDKMPIGIFNNMQPFINHEIKIAQGDKFYLFSDGYPDQFGGPKGKKLKIKMFNELLLKTSQLSMEKQGIALEDARDSWMNQDGVKYAKTDDTTVLGFEL